MKKLLSILSVMVLSVMLYAQTPQSFSYQTVIRDASWSVLANQSVGIEISILEDATNGTVVYEESHSATTSTIGLVNLAVGEGSVLSGDFTTIDWGNHSYFIQVAVDVTGGTNYVVMGTTQLRSVPYALYAETSGTPGTPGPQGIPGTDGSDGINGQDGAPGLAGADGTDGAPGTNGTNGTDGADGINGQDGAPGLAGADGTDGAPGTNGTNGTDGADGINGQDGAPGTNGTNGTDGADGTNGTNGADGATGPAGADGQSAYDIAVANSYTGVLITEMDLGSPDMIEIQNVGDAPIDVTGWTVVVNDDYNAIPSTTTQILSGVMNSGAIQSWNDNSSSFWYWGDNIFFSPSANNGGWVMLLDPNGAVVDFVAAGLSALDPANDVITYGGVDYSISSMWSGAFVSGTSSSNDALIRQGTSDNNDASDWLATTTTWPAATTNAGLTLPWGGFGAPTEAQWLASLQGADGAPGLPGADGATGPAGADGAPGLPGADGTDATAIFTTTSNVTSNANGNYATDDFVFGSSTLDWNSNNDHATRMFFDKSKGAFRVGGGGPNNFTNMTVWDEDSIGMFSFATGYKTKATGAYSTAMGYYTEASGNSSTAMGISTKASGFNTTAMGDYSIASGLYSTAMGSATHATGDYSTAMGFQTEATGDYSVAMGHSTKASGHSPTAMGYNTEASGNHSTAMGYGTIASGAYSVAMGGNTEASGLSSTAMGYETIASMSWSTAMGFQTEATGDYSTAMGYNVTASGTGELYNSGNIKGLSFVSTSDRRVKQNIAPFSGALSKVMLLSPKTYFYNTVEFPRFEAEKDKPQIGFIAQEVEAIFPEMVTTDGDEVGLKGVRYGQLTAVLVQAIKEQQEIIRELQKEVKELKKTWNKNQ